jgi:hypothetical protein
MMFIVRVYLGGLRNRLRLLEVPSQTVSKKSYQQREIRSRSYFFREKPNKRWLLAAHPLTPHVILLSC